jgi:hypothetical protein
MSALYRLPVSLALALSVLAISAASLRAQAPPDEVGSTAPADSAEATGEDSDRAPDQEIVQNRKLPILDGHRFIPNSTVPDPFITTFLRSNTGFGFLLDANIPVLTEADTVAVLQGDIAFAVLGFEYQQAIVDFLALRIGFGGAIRTGTNGETLIAEGLNASYSFGVGVTGRVFHTEDFYLSAVLDYESNKIIAVDPFGFAQRVAEECGGLPEEDVAECILDTDETLLQSGRASALTGGARAAWSPIEWFGLRGRVELGAGDVSDVESDFGTFILNLGLLADFDLLEVTPVPLGFMLGFDGQIFGGRGSDLAESATRFNAGIFYTGRKEFSVGVEGIFGRVALAKSDENVDSITINLRLRYFF